MSDDGQELSTYGCWQVFRWRLILIPLATLKRYFAKGKDTVSFTEVYVFGFRVARIQTND